MKAIWILPDRHQHGTMLLDQEGRIEPVHTALPMATLPKALTLGIPEELFQANRDQPVFWVQYARLSHSENLFAASLEAGKDISGRVVVLTLLVRLHAQETLQAEDITQFKAPTSEVECAQKLLRELARQFGEHESPLNALLAAVRQFPEYRTFASETLRRAVNRPDWMKKKSDGIQSGMPC
ncbi:hypothetical protein [Burkholderia cepacia]|uniref:hypothetical protein n=1 Tax=Burkholderia cepacia TaxID=292 RepID=UPI00158EF5E3|nr:hypothetical protein [Burkholderia cepacia]